MENLVLSNSVVVYLFGKPFVLSGLSVIVAFVVGFLIAQAIKVMIFLIQKRGKVKTSEILNCLVKSGGMPSGHAASFTAAVLMIGIITKFDSVVFALSVCTLIIVLYDAMNVRYAVGEQGKVLNMLSKKQLKVVEGHTLPQVLVGMLVGAIACGIALFI